ncbi:DUF4326 domain-containing protein [Providencia vermicola]|uniref:DUF4326 domain-containing protein n=1 Tax=Providencia vermicola TaxID=333965 RepID=UPI00352699AE
MSILFIDYRSEFNCYEKFYRKVAFLTKNIKITEIIYRSDYRGFIDKISSELSIKVKKLDSVEEANYAIIFKDKRDDVKDYNFNEDTRVKIINLNLTLVVNKDKGDKFDVYIGRGTIWGNPYQIGIDGDRDEVIRKYKYDFDKGFLKPFDDIDRNILAIRGKVIACHCKPYPCHGDIISDYINSIDDGE